MGGKPQGPRGLCSPSSGIIGPRHRVQLYPAGLGDRTRVFMLAHFTHKAVSPPPD